jgi:acetyl esterase/lipase
VLPGDGVRYVDPVFDDVDIARGLRFGQAVNDFGKVQKLRLDLYEPTGDIATDRPAVVYAHGGGFVAGGRDDDRQLDYLRGLAQRGYVVVSIDYRLRPKGTPNPEGGANIAKEWAVAKQSPVVREAQHDMQAAVRWVRARAAELGVDPDTIIVSGGSAGAITAWSTGVNPEDPGDSGTPGPSSEVAAVVSLWGGMSPHEMEAGAPPVLDVHGTKDVPVPLPLATAACARMNSLLDQCEQYLLPNGKHPAWEYVDDFFPEVTGFLCRTVLSSCASEALVSPVRVGPTEPGGGSTT